MSDTVVTSHKVALVSPFSRHIDEYDLPVNQSEHNLTCPQTNKAFRAVIVTIVKKDAKRARNGGRDFIIQAKLADGTDRRIQFNHGRDEDFELKPKESVAFLYEGDKVLYVHNLTTRHTWGISSWGF